MYKESSHTMTNMGKRMVIINNLMKNLSLHAKVRYVDIYMKRRVTTAKFTV